MLNALSTVRRTPTLTLVTITRIVIYSRAISGFTLENPKESGRYAGNHVALVVAQKWYQICSAEIDFNQSRNLQRNTGMNKGFNFRRPFRCNVLDVEASGLGSNSYPVEVGVVMADGTEYQAVIKPADSWEHWSEEAEAMHGLSREYIEANGQSIRQVCLDLNRLCRNETLYTDCWVHDLPWILKLFEQAGMYPAFKCMPIESVLKEHQISNWVKHKSKIGACFDLKPHRALNDARIIAKTLQRLRTQNEIIIAKNLKRVKPIDPQTTFADSLV